MSPRGSRRICVRPRDIGTCHFCKKTSRRRDSTACFARLYKWISRAGRPRIVPSEEVLELGCKVRGAFPILRMSRSQRHGVQHQKVEKDGVLNLLKRLVLLISDPPLRRRMHGLSNRSFCNRGVLTWLFLLMADAFLCQVKSHEEGS